MIKTTTTKRARAKAPRVNLREAMLTHPDYTGPVGSITGYWQMPKAFAAVINYGDILSVPGYSYGFFAFGSVAGYAAKNHDDTEAAILRARQNHHELVWVSHLPSVIDCSGKTGEQKAMEGAPAGARHYTLALGSVVWFEGRAYRLDKAANNNVGLTPVVVHFDGEVIIDTSFDSAELAELKARGL